MKILYNDKKTEDICTDLKNAIKYMGGNKPSAQSLMSRISALKSADCLKDIVNFQPFRFHKLVNKGKEKNLEGCFAIDIKSIKDKWRIILEPLDDNENPFNPCNIDEISKIVRIVKIRKVSNHYE